MTVPRPFLFIVSGLPGTGKTSFARALAAALNADHLNTDGIRTEMGLRGLYLPAIKREVYNKLLQHAASALKAGHIVVIDGTFYRESLRQDFLQLAKRLDVAWQWIELSSDESVIRERVRLPRPDSEADYSVYLQVKRQYEPLRLPHLSFSTTDVSVDTLVQLTLQHWRAPTPKS